MNSNKLLISFIVLLTLFLPACVHVEVTTILNADGSMDRIVDVRSDSKLKDYSGLPFAIDSTWEVVSKFDSLESSTEKYVYSFKKHYKNADELNNDYKKVPNSLGKFSNHVKVEKKFRWFYTYLRFEENYKKMAKGSYRPFRDYLSDIEKEVQKAERLDSLNKMIQFDSVSIEKYKKGIKEKNDKWLEDNLKEEVLLSVEQDMKNCKVQNIKIESIKEKSDTIFKAVDLLSGNSMTLKMYQLLNKWFKTNEFDKIINSPTSCLGDFEKKIDSTFGQTGFKYKLQVPGLLIDANAESINGNLLSWQFEPSEAFFVDTSFYAESRIINVWAFIVSGVFVLAVIILIMISGFRRKNSSNI